jgi:hypothetical protein
MANETSTIPETASENQQNAAGATQAVIEQPASQPVVVENPSGGGKELIFGFGALLIVALVAFFIRNAYANHLISQKKIEPRRANMAGWCLFGTLVPLAAIAIFAFVDPSKFLGLLYLLPLGAISLISFVLMISSSKSK